MKYSEARDRIQTGDCVGVKTRSVGGWFVRLGQHIAGLKWAKYGHTGVAIWVNVAGEDRLMIAEMNQGGDMYRPLSQYVNDGCEVAIFCPPKGASMLMMGHTIRMMLDQHIAYGWLDLIPLGIQLVLRRFIGKNSVGKDGGHDQVCSYFTMRLYNALGAKMDVPNRPAPAEVLDVLDLKFELETAK